MLMPFEASRTTISYTPDLPPPKMQSIVVLVIEVMLSSYLFSPFCTRYTLVEAWVPKFEPVIVMADLRIGDEDVLERAVIWGAMFGL